MATLIVDSVFMRETPQTGTWLFCFRVYDPNTHEAIEFHIPNQEYEDDGITIALETYSAQGKNRMEIPNVVPGQRIRWWMGLDDDESDVCRHDRAEDQCTGRLLVKAGGKKTIGFNPEHNWSFDIRYHLE